MIDLQQLGPRLIGAIEDFQAEIDEARRVVANARVEALKAVEPFMGKKEAAEFLNISVSTLENRMAEKNSPPRYIDGGKVSFLRSELRAWRRQWRVGNTVGIQEP